MNRDIVEGNWKVFKGKIKAQWGRLTDDHLEKIAGEHEQWAGKIQKTYSATKTMNKRSIRELGFSQKS